MIARTLRRRVVLRTADAAVCRALGYLQCTPDISGYLMEELLVTIESYRGRYLIRTQGDTAREELSPNAVVQYLHGYLFGLSIEDIPRAPLIHAACLRRGGRRILLTGPSGVGKTTLTLKLLRAGYDIEGDEHVFLTERGVVARPRALRVKQSALDALPDFAEAIVSAPFLSNHLNQKIYNFDPRSIGAAWQIEEGPVDHIVLLRANHGGASSIRKVSPLGLAQQIMAECGLPPASRGRAVALVAALAASAKGFDLSVGDPQHAVRCIDCLFDGAERAS